MRSILLAATSVAAMLTLPSCVTYDDCTRDWFEAQSQDIQRDFQRRNRVPLRRIQTLRTDMDEGLDVFTVLALASAKRDIERLVADFRAQVIPEARSIASRCELDQGFDLIVDAFLAEQGVDTELVRALGLMGLFDDPVLRTTLEPVDEARAPTPATDGVRARSGL